MFAHLHVHSHFSLLESCIRINELVDAAASLDMKAIALTDKYAMNGTVEFCKLAKARGIKPITGCEVCLMHPDDSLNLSHLTLLAIDGKGYKNLCSLVTKSHTRDKKNTMHPALPYIIMNELEKFCDGIICLSGCSKGWLGALLKANSFDRAKLFAKKLYGIFGQNFYVEIQRYSLEFPAYHPNLNPASEMLAAFSNKFKIPAVATNNVHYLSPADYKTYRYMTKIKMMGTKNDPLFNIIENQELYLKSMPQMAALFRDIPGAIVNTQHIADKCNFDFRHDSLCLPCFETPYGQSQQDYLEKICIEGLKSRFGNNPPDTARKRLAKELNAIKTAGFAGYFLVVADMARFAHENNIPVCGKGSAAGSLISYILKISNVDPIENNLYFERFLNEGRKKPPDIDIDVSSKDRPRIWEYLKSKYGTGCVSRVASFSTTKPRSSIRESGRILNAAKEEIDSIIKAAPGYNRFFTENKMNRVLEKSNLLDLNSPEVKRILSVSKKISGYIRHISMHPSAFIVSNSNLSEKIPMTFSEDKELMSQYDMNSIEDLGILKIDLINSLSLDLICNVLKQIEKTRNISLDMQKIQYSDTGVFKMIQSGDTLGVFQLESFGIRTLARKIKPCCLNDITLLISLYRPGPQQSGMVDKFIERKFKREAVTYMHKDLEPILRETFGVILYQEQAMQVAMKIAGYSLSEADELRKAISDLSREKILSQKDKFFKGGLKNGYRPEIINEVFNLISKFASYAFVKAHAAAYAELSYKTCYLKFRFPAEFLSTILTNNSGYYSRMQYMEEARRLGIDLRLPDINKSEIEFTVEDGGSAIRAPLGCIKSLGFKGLRSILQERRKNGNFKDFFDFFRRLPHGSRINKNAIENLIKVGAFDFTKIPRKSILIQYCRLKSAVKYVPARGCRSRDNKDKNEFKMPASQMFDTLFFGQDLIGCLQEYNPGENKKSSSGIICLPDYSLEEKIELEAKILGFYISSHPLKLLKEKLKNQGFSKNCIISSKYFYNFFNSPGSVAGCGKKINLAANINILAAGMVVNKRIEKTKSGKDMMFCTIEDEDGMYEAIFFCDVYNRSIKIIEDNPSILLQGRLNLKDNNVSLIVKDVCSAAVFRLMEELHNEEKVRVSCLSGVEKLWH